MCARALGLSDWPQRLARRVAASVRLQIIKLRVNLPVEHVLQACHPRVDAEAARQALRAGVSGLAHTRPKGPGPASTTIAWAAIFHCMTPTTAARVVAMC